MIMGVVVLAVALVFSRVSLPEIVHTEAPRAADGTQNKLWSCRLFTFGLLALFCYEIAEISINSFFINYVTDDGWLDARDASLILSFGGLGLFMCGRFVGSWVMRFVRAERALLCCAVGAVAAVGVVLLNVGVVSRVSLLLVYVCEAIMFPTIFAIALKGLGIYTQRASSYLMMSPIGGAVGPLLMGYVADTTSMTFSFIVPLLAFVIVLFYAAFADRIERKSGK
jgi:FHS family L-fucose permease-like MFS transporter